MREKRIPLTLACASILLAGSVLTLPFFAPGRVDRLSSHSLLPISAARSPTAADRATSGSLDQTGSAPIPSPVQVAARGRVEPSSEQLELSIGLVGTISNVYVAAGDPVTKGQLLAELDNADQKARVGEAQATLMVRKAELDKLLNGARPEERRIVAAQYEETLANLVLAGQDVDRRTPLAANGISSKESLDQAISAFGVAKAKTDAKAAALALINAPPRDEDIAMAKANITLAKADLDVQLSLLEKTQLRSPTDGVVLRRYLKPGETISVQPLMPILQVGDIHHLRVRAEIDESDVGRVALGQQAWVSAPAYPNQRFRGVVSWISPAMGRKTVGSDQPTEKNDTKVLDVLIDLDADAKVPVGLRVDVSVGQSKMVQD